MLVAAGGNLSLRDADGQTPMMHAFQANDHDLAAYLESEFLFLKFNNVVFQTSLILTKIFDNCSHGFFPFIPSIFAFSKCHHCQPIDNMFAKIMFCSFEKLTS